VVWEFDGHLWAGLPLDPRRRIPGYLEVGDEVLVCGHAPVEYSRYFADPNIGQLHELAELDPLQWIIRQRRKDWDSSIPTGQVGRITEVVRSDKQDPSYTSSAYVDDRTTSVSHECLALPVELHRQRRAQLVEQDLWFDWQDQPVCLH
jgi:hypothetical protein